MWPPGKRHDDLQYGRKEIFRLGEWSIYSSGSNPATVYGWDSYIMHCAEWKERRRKPTQMTTTIYMGRDIASDTPDEFDIEIVTRRCNENMAALGINRCPGCNRKIPDEVVAVWTLQNFDKIQEFNSV